MVRGEATFRPRDRGRPGGTRTRTREGVARWASRRACGTWATPPMAGTALGERGRSGVLAAATARARGTALGRAGFDRPRAFAVGVRSEEHTSELHSLMRH